MLARLIIQYEKHRCARKIRGPDVWASLRLWTRGILSIALICSAVNQNLFRLVIPTLARVLDNNTALFLLSLGSRELEFAISDFYITIG